VASPERYPIVRGTEGLRKIRFVPSRQARGKSGAYSVGYVRFREFGFILLVTVWGKNDKSDLSARDRNGIAEMVRDIRRTLGAQVDSRNRVQSSHRRVRKSSLPWSDFATRSGPGARSSSDTLSVG
jgi:hypothetical protein